MIETEEEEVGGLELEDFEEDELVKAFWPLLLVLTWQILL